MKKLSLLVAGLLFASSSVHAADNNNHDSSATASNETVRIMVVDKTRKPFRRTIETLTVTDIAALENAGINNVADSPDRSRGKRTR